MRWHALHSGPHAAARLVRSYVIALSAGAILFAWLVGQVRLGTMANLLIGLVVTIVALWAYEGWVRPWRVGRFFAKQSFNHEELAFTFTPTHVVFVAAHTRTELKWSAFHRVVATPEGMLLYTQEHWFKWVPRSGFGPGDFGKAARLARTHAGKFIAGRGSPTLCATCGYDLNGLALTAACPECGGMRGA